MTVIEGNGWTASFGVIDFRFDRGVDHIDVFADEVESVDKTMSDLRMFCAKNTNATVSEITNLLNNFFGY